MFEKDFDTKRTCGAICGDDEYRDFTDKVCYSCEDAVPGCTSCEYNVEEMYV